MSSKLKPHYNAGGAPLCGRHLSTETPGEDRFIRDFAKMQLTADIEKVECRHCQKLIRQKLGDVGLEPEPELEEEEAGDE